MSFNQESAKDSHGKEIFFDGFLNKIRCSYESSEVSNIMTFEFKDYVLSGRFSDVANQAVVRAVAEAKTHNLKIPVAPALQQPPSDQDPLDLTKWVLIVAPVAGPDGAWTIVVGYLLGYLQSTAIAQLFHDLGGR